MKNNEINDTVFEALFRQAVIDDYIEEVDAIPSNEVLAKVYPLSPAFELRMKRLFARERRKDIYRTVVKYSKKVAVFLLIFTSIFFSALLFNPEVRAAVSKVVVEWYEQFTSFTFNREVTKNEQNELRPEYLPNGYVESSIETFSNITDILYTNEAGEEIRYSYRPSDSTTEISVDNENHSVRERSINNNIAFVMTALENSSDFDNGVVFEHEGFVISIWSKLHVDELIKIAESVSAE